MDADQHGNGHQPDHGATDGSPVAEADAKATLERVLASQAFANAGRLSRFLRFASERAIGGEAERLKEYLLGVEVFDRTDAFDPRIDSIVRVEARRLRTKLAEYYEEEGAGDPIVIKLRKGSYAPRFEWRNGRVPAVSAEPAAALDAAPGIGAADSRTSGGSHRWLWAAAAALLAAGAIWVYRSAGAPAPPGLSVAVLPLVSYSGDPSLATVADDLTDGILAELARRPNLVVRSRTSSQQFRNAKRPIREVSRALDARFLVEATVRSAGDSLEVEARVVDASTDRKVWVDDFVGTRAGLRDLERRTAAGIASAVTRHAGTMNATP